jgi:hypothetical protein
MTFRPGSPGRVEPVRGAVTADRNAVVERGAAAAIPQVRLGVPRTALEIAVHPARRRADHRCTDCAGHYNGQCTQCTITHARQAHLPTKQTCASHA